MTSVPHCQYCATPLTVTWLDLGEQPLANHYAATQEEAVSSPHYPLHARACPACWLVQVDRVVPPDDIFSDYAYFSSYSDSWLEHCRRYAATVTDRFALNGDSLVIEIASNDGYQLKFFKDAGIPVLGVDPAANVAAVAQAAGIPTEVEFFGAAFARTLVERGQAADHLVAKNVLAHVPDIGDFVEGVAILLKPEAVFSVEFPHLLRTMRQLQFDQIYHEHFTYLSLVALDRIARDKGLRIFDVDRLETHGGSLRVYMCRDGAAHPTTDAVAATLDEERAAGLDTAEGYAGYDGEARRIREEFIDFIATAKREGRAVAGYGAAAKGNTFLNFCGADAGTLAFIADRSAAKAGRFMPGSGIPVRLPEAIDEARSDYVVILPWNLKDEISAQLEGIREWGGRFVIAVPGLRTF